MKTKIWKNGTVHCTADQVCDECSKPVKPIFIDTPNDPDTWFWRECDHCFKIACEDCSDSDHDGIVTCITCLQDPNHGEIK